MVVRSFNDMKKYERKRPIGYPSKNINKYTEKKKLKEINPKIKLIILRRSYYRDLHFSSLYFSVFSIIFYEYLLPFINWNTEVVSPPQAFISVVKATAICNSSRFRKDTTTQWKVSEGRWLPSWQRTSTARPMKNGWREGDVYLEED